MSAFEFQFCPRRPHPRAHFYLLLVFYVLADGGRWAAGYSLRLVSWWLNARTVQAVVQDIDMFKSLMDIIP